MRNRSAIAGTVTRTPYPAPSGRHAEISGEAPRDPRCSGAGIHIYLSAQNCGAACAECRGLSPLALPGGKPVSTLTSAGPTIGLDEEDYGGREAGTATKADATTATAIAVTAARGRRRASDQTW